MKKVKIIVIAVLFAALLIVTALIFPKLRESYNETTQAQNETQAETKAEAQSTAEEAASDFTVYDIDGNPVKLSDFVGKPTVVNFWATWCVYCVEELPYFNTLYEEYKNKVNFVMVDLPDGYNETQSTALEFTDEKGYTFPVYFDTDNSASLAYSISGIPMTLLVDKDGGLYKVHNGLMDEEALRNYIETLLGE